MSGFRGLLFAVCLLTALGCTQTRTVTVPAGEPTINATTDTVRIGEYPPVELQGTVTVPETRSIIDDTASNPAISVQRVEVDNRPDEGEVRFLWEEGSRTIRDAYQLPVYGEMLVWRQEQVDREGYPIRSTPANQPRDTPADTVRKVDTVRVQPKAEVVGTPTEQKVEADVSSIKPPWYRRLWMQIRLVLAFVGGAFAGYVVTKLVPGL